MVVALKQMLAEDPTLSWEVLPLLPRQGHWNVQDYLFVNERTNRYIELNHGRIEVLEMPTKRHQKIVLWLASRFELHCGRTGAGEVVMAPYPLKTSEHTYREPDVVVVLAEHKQWLKNQMADGADLVVEVLSEDRNRDLVDKRSEYASAGIREYWLVDARDHRITVLVLRDGEYVVHGEATTTGVVTSAILAGFSVDVAEIMAAASEQRP
jgi:Uma2 family endonuclease